MQFTADVSRYGDKVTVRIGGTLRGEFEVAKRLAAALCQDGESVAPDADPSFSASHGYLFTIIKETA